MSNSRTETVRAEITKTLARMVPDRLLDDPTVEGHRDLLEFVDSFGFVQLLMAVEEPLGIELDLTTVDLGSIVRLDDLTAFILKSYDNLPTSGMVEAG